MCFGSSMSSTTKNLTSSMVTLANTMAGQAKKIFGAADKTFNTISNSMTPIVNAGPSQFGYSQGAWNAMNAEAVNAGAVEKRNLIASAQTSGQPVNVAAIDQLVGNQTATAENQIIQSGYKQGNENWKFASGSLESAPSIYGTAISADNSAMNALGTATKAQEARDAAGGGWKNLVKAGVGILGDIGGSFIGDPMLGNQIEGVASAVTGGGGGSSTSQMFGAGAGNLDTTGGSSFGEQVTNFFEGMGQQS